MYSLYEIAENGDAILNGVFEHEEDAVKAAESLFSYQIEVNFGWGSRVIERVIIELGNE